MMILLASFSMKRSGRQSNGDVSNVCTELLNSQEPEAKLIFAALRSMRIARGSVLIVYC
jgi:hypothetical protein